MAVNIGDIFEIVKKIIDLEARVEEAIKNEKDKKRRKKIMDAFKRRDLDALRDLLFG